MIRGCGQRKVGGLYICTDLSPEGKPLEFFIIDSPIPYPGQSFRSPQLVERGGTTHALVWVGAEYYPYASDFIEEVRRFGASRRIPINFPIDQLSAGSKMFLIHGGAIIENYRELPEVEQCPLQRIVGVDGVPSDLTDHIPAHLANEEYCITHVYQAAGTAGGIRRIGETEYRVSDTPCRVQLNYRHGIFMRLPINHIDYVRDGGRVAPRLVGLTTSVPLRFVDE